MAAQQEVCSCGTRQAEWDADPQAYVGDYRQCSGCELIEMEHDNIPEGMKGTHVSLVPMRLALLRAESLSSADPHRPPVEGPGL